MASACKRAMALMVELEFDVLISRINFCGWLVARGVAIRLKVAGLSWLLKINGEGLVRLNIAFCSRPKGPSVGIKATEMVWKLQQFSFRNNQCAFLAKAP